MQEALRRMREGEPPAAVSDAYLGHAKFKDFIDFAEIMATERKYSVPSGAGPAALFTEEEK
jgi:hypothetical protein